MRARAGRRLWCAAAVAVALSLCACLSARLCDGSLAHMRVYWDMLVARTGRDAGDTDAETLTLREFAQVYTLHEDDGVCEELCLSAVAGGVDRDGDGRVSWQEFANAPDWQTLRRFGLAGTGVDGKEAQVDMGDGQRTRYAPREVHLALTGVQGEMRVMWVTRELLDDPRVEYRRADREETGEAGAWQVAEAAWYGYEVPKKWWHVFNGVIYNAVMTGLDPETRYVYRVRGENPETGGRREQSFAFVSPPAVDPERPTTFATYGDMGTVMPLGFAVADALIAQQDELDIDLYMHVGDVAYAGLSTNIPALNITSDDEFEWVWDLFGEQNEPLTSTRPYMTGYGNHEKFYNATAFTARYIMPGEASGGNENFWFSFDYGPAHFVSMSSEHDYSEGSPQYEWFLADLEAAQARRGDVPWIIVTMHRPLLCSDASETDQHSPDSAMFATLMPVLIDYDVDLTVQGHMHAYERVHVVDELGDVSTYPEQREMPSPSPTGADEACDVYDRPTGPVNVVQGNAGALQMEGWVQPQPEWSAVRFANGVNHGDQHASAKQSAQSSTEGVLRPWANYTDTYGFGVIGLMNSTHLRYSSVPITGDIGSDLFWVIKDRD